MELIELSMPIMFIVSVIAVWRSFSICCDECGFQVFAIGLFGSIGFGIGTIITIIHIVEG
jgi:hypothetical protein